MDKNKLKELVNLAGSAASITGVSLLWLKDMVPGSRLAVAVPFFAIGSLLSVGIVATAYLLFKFGYNFFLGGYAIPREEPSPAAKLAYAGFAGATLIGFTLYALWAVFYLAWTFARDVPAVF